MWRVYLWWVEEVVVEVFSLRFKLFFGLISTALKVLSTFIFPINFCGCH